MFIDRLGQRMADFVGTTGAKVLHAVEEVVPGLEPPRRRLPGLVKVALTAGAAIAAGVGSAAARRSGLVGDGQTADDSSELADAPTELASKSWADLMQMAREADIKGRSGMKKDQLVKALSSSSNGR